MLDKTVPSLADAVSGIVDGATLMIGGFGGSGIPTDLIRALLDQGACDLTIVNNNAGNGPLGLSELIAAGRVRKVICSYARSANPKNPSSAAFAEWYRAGRIELECVPQGTMADRMHAAGAGPRPLFPPPAHGTPPPEGQGKRGGKR